MKSSCCCSKKSVEIAELDKPPMLKLKQGDVIGKTKNVLGKSVSIYSDIPFAECVRFEKPTPYGAWEGVWDGTGETRKMPVHHVLSTAFLESGSPLIKPLFAALRYTKKEVVISEKTLHLTVTVPEGGSPTKPVMVWIHGGGWVGGCAEDLDSSALSAHGDVIVVNITYRLGFFGFLFGNWGLFDHLEALKWVQDNVSAIGGDKNNVTIFGQSAGAWSVEALMCSPLAKNLFHAGIAQSGSLQTQFLNFSKISENPMYAHLMEKFEKISVQSLKEHLKTFSIEDINNLTLEVFMNPAFQTCAVACWDEEFFVENPMTQKVFVNKVPFITGQCDTEFGLLHYQLFKDWKNQAIIEGILSEILAAKGVKNPIQAAAAKFVKIKETYEIDPETEDDFIGISCNYMGDGGFHGGLSRAATLDSPVWCFEFCHKSKMLTDEPFKNGNEIVDPVWSKASHCADTVYTFGVPFQKEIEFEGGRYFSEEEKLLSKRMMTSWTDFAKTGNPGWEEYTKETKLIKEFNETDKMKSENDDYMRKRTELFQEDYSLNINA